MVIRARDGGNFRRRAGGVRLVSLLGYTRVLEASESGLECWLRAAILKSLEAADNVGDVVIRIRGPFERVGFHGVA